MLPCPSLSVQQSTAQSFAHASHEAQAALAQAHEEASVQCQRTLARLNPVLFWFQRERLLATWDEKLRPFTPRPPWRSLYAQYRDLDASASLLAACDAADADGQSGGGGSNGQSSSEHADRLLKLLRAQAAHSAALEEQLAQCNEAMSMLKQRQHQHAGAAGAGVGAGGGAALCPHCSGPLPASLFGSGTGAGTRGGIAGQGVDPLSAARGDLSPTPPPREAGVRFVKPEVTRPLCLLACCLPAACAAFAAARFLSSVPHACVRVRCIAFRPRPSISLLSAPALKVGRPECVFMPMRAAWRCFMLLRDRLIDSLAAVVLALQCPRSCAGAARFGTAT